MARSINNLSYLCLFFLTLFMLSTNALAVDRLLVFAGSASKPPTEEAARLFEKKTGAKVELIFGGSGFVLSQMLLSKQGDIYFPGSSDFMEIAKKKGAVLLDTEQRLVYLAPAINVQKGNPKKIRSLRDLLRPGIRVAIANPEGVCVGLYAVEIIEKALSAAEKAALRKNLVNYTESCEKTATAISLKAVDAVIGWGVFQFWDPARIETVPLARREIQRVGYIPIAVSSYSKHRPLAQKFIQFLSSAEGAAIFRRHHYFMTPDEAFTWIGEKKPVGGEFPLPRQWSIR